MSLSSNEQESHISAVDLNLTKNIEMVLLPKLKKNQFTDTQRVEKLDYCSDK
jgi:hypothetical protein